MKDRNINHSDNWATPHYVYSVLDKMFNFDFDPCPINHNLEEFDGLEIDWRESNYINPPYSQKLKEAFISKALEESKKGKTCVLLLPASTSTKIFHEIILPNASKIWFVKKRIKFEGVNTFGEFVNNKAPMHDSMIIVFDNKRDLSLSLQKLRGLSSKMELIKSLIDKKTKLENLYCRALADDKKRDILFYSSRLHCLDRQFYNLGYEINPIILSSDFLEHRGEKEGLTSPPLKILENAKKSLTSKIQILALGGVKNANF